MKDAETPPEHNLHYASLLLELEEIKNKLEDQQIKYDNIISGYQQRINELEMQNSKLISENEELKKNWDNRFNDQQSRIESIIEIARHEHKDIYDKIISLINDQN